MKNRPPSCIIIEDELKARQLLAFLIKKVAPEIEILAECEDLKIGISAIKTYQPDIVFLDIHLPNNLGLELYDYLEEVNFQVIFTTAYDEYAVKAFELCATDYLLKPIHPDRLKKAISRVKTEPNNLRGKDPFSALNSANNQIALLRNNTYFYKPVEEIICVEADRSYCTVVFDEEQFTLSKSLNKVEQLLSNKAYFIRVHRSWCINLNSVHSISFSDNQISLKNGMVVPIGKSYKKTLKECYSKT